MIGLVFNNMIDVWSLACCLYEMYTGQIAFQGKDNNEMLAQILAITGGYAPKHRPVHGRFYYEHFNDKGEFLETVKDTVSDMLLVRPTMTSQKPKRDMLDALHPKEGWEIARTKMNLNDRRKVTEFKDLLLKMFTLSPNFRLSPEMALKHQFCVRPLNSPK